MTRMKHWNSTGMGLGFLVSFVFIAISSAVFLNSEKAYEWQPELEHYCIKPGTSVTWRSEGWARTHYGKYDVPGIPDISRLSGPKIAIWGDSYVEALQVDDDRKVARVLTGLAAERGMSGLSAFEIGHSGEGIADYYFWIPKYERIVRDIKAHFIIITDDDDVLPGRQLRPHSLFLTDPASGLVEGMPYEPAGSLLPVRNWLHEHGFDFIISLYRSAQGITIGLPGAVRTVQRENGEEAVTNPSPDGAWRYLLESLRAHAGARVVFVYCPPVPSLTDGGVSWEDKNRQVVRAFASECSRLGIGFIDMTESFAAYYRGSGRFPRGFPNSRPAIGHLNEAGHRLVAERLLEYLLEHRDLTHVAYAN